MRRNIDRAGLESRTDRETNGNRSNQDDVKKEAAKAVEKMLWDIAARARLEARKIVGPIALSKDSSGANASIDNITATAPPARAQISRARLGSPVPVLGLYAAADLATDGGQLVGLGIQLGNQVYAENEPYKDEDEPYEEHVDVLDARSENEEPFDNITATAPPTRTVTSDKLAEAFAHGFTAAADLAADEREPWNQLGIQLGIQLYTEDEQYGDEDEPYDEDVDVLDDGSENKEYLDNTTATAPPTRTATTEGLAECFAQIVRANHTVIRELEAREIINPVASPITLSEDTPVRDCREDEVKWDIDDDPDPTVAVATCSPLLQPGTLSQKEDTTTCEHALLLPDTEHWSVYWSGRSWSTAGAGVLGVLGVLEYWELEQDVLEWGELPTMQDVGDGPMQDIRVDRCDTPPPRFDTLQCEAGAARFAGGPSPTPCRPEGGVTRDRSLQRAVGDRGGTCRATCSGEGGHFLNDHHIHEGPAPRRAFNKVGIG